MILDLGSFTRRELMVNCVSPAKTCGGGGDVDKAWKEQRVQAQEGGGRRKRYHRPLRTEVKSFYICLKLCGPFLSLIVVGIKSKIIGCNRKLWNTKITS